MIPADEPKEGWENDNAQGKGDKGRKSVWWLSQKHSEVTKSKIGKANREQTFVGSR